MRRNYNKAYVEAKRFNRRYGVIQTAFISVLKKKEQENPSRGLLPNVYVAYKRGFFLTFLFLIKVILKDRSFGLNPR